LLEVLLHEIASEAESDVEGVRVNPTERTLQRLRKEGWQVAVVEKWLKQPGMAFGRRIDVWGIGDLLACRPATEDCPAVTALVQVTSASSHAEHRDKILGRITAEMTDKEKKAANERVAAAKTWKACGNIVWLISWRQNKRGRWIPREEQL
jgi:hypothetical protein